MQFSKKRFSTSNARYTRVFNRGSVLKSGVRCRESEEQGRRGRGAEGQRSRGAEGQRSRGKGAEEVHLYLMAKASPLPLRTCPSAPLLLCPSAPLLLCPSAPLLLCPSAPLLLCPRLLC